MKNFEIWSEGYMATGEHGTAIFHGKYNGNSFDEAVEVYIKHKEETDFKDIRKYYSCNERYVDTPNGRELIICTAFGLVDYLIMKQMQENHLDSFLIAF